MKDLTFCIDEKENRIKKQKRKRGTRMKKKAVNDYA